VALAGLTVYVAGAWRAAGRATEKRDFESYRAGHDAGTRAFASAGSDELNWFDYALRVFYRRYCADERLLSNWVRATVESKLEGLEVSGLRGITIPYPDAGVDVDVKMYPKKTSDVERYFAQSSREMSPPVSKESSPEQTAVRAREGASKTPAKGTSCSARSGSCA
jgi:hypothetical protein